MLWRRRRTYFVVDDGQAKERNMLLVKRVVRRWPGGGYNIGFITIYKMYLPECCCLPVNI